MGLESRGESRSGEEGGEEREGVDFGFGMESYSSLLCSAFASRV